MRFWKFVFLVSFIDLVVFFFLRKVFNKKTFQELNEDRYSKEEIHEVLDFL